MVGQSPAPFSDPDARAAQAPARFLDRRSPPHVLTLILLAGLSGLSMNIFLPSLPGMAVFFDAPYALMQMSVSLYLLLSAALQVIVGPLSDRYGRRPVMLWSGAVFLAATVGVLLAEDIWTFLACRMLQAAIVTGMVLSRTVVRDTVPGDRAASVLGYVTIGIALVPMVGPVVGGFLDHAFGWHASFLALLAGGVAVMALAWGDLGETNRIRSASLGAQMRLYPRLLGSRRFWGYALAAMFAAGPFFAYLGGAPFVGAEIFGLSSAQVGIFFALPALGYALGNFLTGRFSARLGTERMVLAGVIVQLVAMVLLCAVSLADAMAAWIFFGLVGAGVGIGNGLTIPNASVGMMSVRPELAGSAAGLGGALTIGGGAGLSSVAGILLVPGASELPLLILMLVSTLGAWAAILWVVRRNRTLGL
jgi:DHA1 family bicyclomycin/chloramphenicol resistance-like MFS transporter